MARPRTFDERRAVAAAMKAFWRSGYEGTSTEDLCTATGLGRSSIYNTFHSKRDLYLKALTHYIDETTSACVELFESDLPIREKVRQLLWAAVEPPEDQPPGCFVVNTATELAPHDPEVAEVLDRDRQRRLAVMRTAVAAAQAAGELDRDKDPVSLAHYLAAMLSGLRVSTQTGSSRSTRERIVQVALTVF